MITIIAGKDFLFDFERSIFRQEDHEVSVASSLQRVRYEVPYPTYFSRVQSRYLYEPESLEDQMF